MTHLTTVKVSDEFKKLVEDHRLKYSECLRKGIALELAERGVLEYDNRLNLMRRMEKMSRLLEATTQEAEALRAKADTIGV